MSALTFDKNELGNLEYSLQREVLSTDRRGGYMSTTIVCCNTRKYHGLMVCPKDDDDENNYVLLSSVDETIVQHDQTLNPGGISILPILPIRRRRRLRTAWAGSC